MKLQNEICNSFNKYASQYERVAKIQLEIGNRLFERLSYIKIKPSYILDLGCGTGIFSKQLKKAYPDAQLVSLDIAYAMLIETKAKQGVFRKWPLVNADMQTMPFRSGLFDLVFSNQVLHWSSSLPGFLKELKRVMNTDGCLLFSSLGPDSFSEIRQAWSGADDYSHTNAFMDMHDVGDALLAAGFQDPVLDMEKIEVHYPSIKNMMQSLKSQGVKNINPERNAGLTGKRAWAIFQEQMLQKQSRDGKFPLSYEVLYGHAWKPEAKPKQQETETRIAISSIPGLSKAKSTV